jgi:hypothetical protein
MFLPAMARKKQNNIMNLNIRDFQQTLKSLCAQGKQKSAMSEANAFLSEYITTGTNPKEYLYDELILLQTRSAKLEQDWNQGLLDYEKYTKETNKINCSFNEWVSDLKRLDESQPSLLFPSISDSNWVWTKFIYPNVLAVLSSIISVYCWYHPSATTTQKDKPMISSKSPATRKSEEGTLNHKKPSVLLETGPVKPKRMSWGISLILIERAVARRLTALIPCFQHQVIQT